MALFLVLYGSTHQTNQSSRFLLAPTANVDDVSAALDAAQPGQFVTVPHCQDEVETVQLRVQPHLFGAWVVLQVEPGEQAPQPAARARQPDLHEMAQGLETLKKLFGGGSQQQNPAGIGASDIVTSAGSASVGVPVPLGHRRPRGRR